eukprot:9580227-Lingulodinium_polyedra.AAC.1
MHNNARWRDATVYKQIPGGETCLSCAPKIKQQRSKKRPQPYVFIVGRKFKKSQSAFIATQFVEEACWIK